MSPFVQVPIRVLLYKSLGFPYLVCMVLMFLCGLVIPWAVIELVVKRRKLFRVLFLGEI